ncbi:MAG TPA: hypothetical protein VFQ85_18740 [Mycobacteriales bacterium]|jgi:hypothetical protein|nr:hypothetical protein [Mycobacteriales bacterium]
MPDPIVLAHGVGGRADLPVPFWLALYGAGIAVVLSFAALGVLWPSPRLRDDKGRPLPGPVAAFLDSPVTRWVLRALVLAASLLLLAAGLAGASGEESNPLPWFLFIQFWVGLVPLSLLLGPVWRVVNPLRTIHHAISAVSGSDPERGLRELPASIGYWPAAGWLLAFAWVELVLPYRADPRRLAVMVLVYAIANLVAASVYGARWFERGDGFEVYSSLIGRLAPIGRRPDGRLVLRNPLDGLAGLVAEPGLVAVVVVLLGSTAFDGVTRSTLWKEWAGNDTGWAAAPKATLVLAACLAFVAVTYVFATREAGRPAGADRRPLPGVFVHSVVPIMVGYAIAHYFSLLLLEGQQSWILASDPFATGANWFGTAHWTIDFTLVPTRVVATTQIGAIVVGHVLGVIAAHDRAVGTFRGRAAFTGQLPLLAVMVAYTLGGVALLLGT